MTLGERLALATVEARLTGVAIPAPRVGGRYEVIGVLGHGGMGEVFRARDVELDREVALKLVRASTGSIGARERLAAEARVLAQLAHPNVVAVFDVVTERDEVAIVMELVRGRSLRRWLDERARPWPDVLAMIVAAGRGLAAAHTAGIVHRDVKPDNIMIGDDGTVRLVDFGLAHAIAEGTSSGDTTQGTVHGTIGYLAPELADGRLADARSDQLAFCLTAYEALHRRCALVQRPSADRPWPARWEIAALQRSDVPPRIRRAIERGLAADPAQRHVSMDGLLAELAPPSRPRFAWTAL
ncbi:MAG TPA: serine/threonine-protein kinase, partial [Nannocystaceae bacterium]|nr:serine/threonine-protein kinase [Nannocystaceae bacterium]